MHDFVSHILRRYFETTAWNEYNSYLHLTSSSAAILDFPVPTGLSLSISASPTPPFFTTYRLGALPNLRAGIGYIYASTTTPIDFGKSSKDVKLKQIIERFRIVEAPRRPVARKGKSGDEYYWLAGERFVEPRTGMIGKEEGEGEEEGGEYLVYGCMHVPSARLDALWTKRISPTWQLIVTAVSTPPKYPLNALQSVAYAASSSTSANSAKGARGLTGSVDRLDTSTYISSSSSVNLSSSPSSAQQISSTASSSSPNNYGLGPPGSTNLQLTLQRDTGRWFTEYSYSVDDALWGFRVLHNFGTPLDNASSSNNYSTTTTTTGSTSSTGSTGSSTPGDSLMAWTSGGSGGEEHKARLDSPEVDADAGGGLRGRFSAGAEVFVSTVEKSAGLSTGIRFSTLPDTPQPIITPLDPANQHSGPSQPPTVITATLNPMMGHLSTAYAARMARDVVVCSRFDFNVYSYESEWTVGAEYWLRRAGQQLGEQQQTHTIAMATAAHVQDAFADNVAPAVAPTLSLRENPIPLISQETSVNATETDAESWSLRPPPCSTSTPSSLPTSPIQPPRSTPSSSSSCNDSLVSTLLSPITGVLKARISTTSDIRLLWQSRLSNCLVSLGVKADLSPSSSFPPSSTQSQPAKMGIVKSIGLEVMYFSAAEEVD